MPSDSRLENSLRSVEDELNLIKNQVHQTLLDIREHILESTNPFILPAFSGLQEPLREDRSSAMGADEGAGAGEEQEEQPDEEAAGDAVAEEEIEEPEAEEEEILESELGAPEDEELLFEDGAGALGSSMAGEDEEETAEEEEPLEDGLEEGEVVGEADEDGLEPAPASRARPLDLISLACLVRWVASALERVGRSRLEILLDAYEQAGRISPEVKRVARTLCELSEEDPSAQIPVRDVIAVMMRLEGVLGDEDAQSSRLLSLVLEDELEPVDSLVASLGLR